MQRANGSHSTLFSRCVRSAKSVQSNTAVQSRQAESRHRELSQTPIVAVVFVDGIRPCMSMLAHVRVDHPRWLIESHAALAVLLPEGKRTLRPQAEAGITGGNRCNGLDRNTVGQCATDRALPPFYAIPGKLRIGSPAVCRRSTRTRSFEAASTPPQVAQIGDSSSVPVPIFSDSASCDEQRL